MAKARTEENYNMAYEGLQETNLFCAEWLNHRKEMFASFILIGRRGIVTTNPVEQFNNVMLEARESPITDALLMLMNKIADLTVERKQQGMRWRDDGMLVVPSANEAFQTNLTEGLRRNVSVRKYPSPTDPVAIADVSCGLLNVNTMLTVTVNISTGKIVCGCRYREEMGIPCVHAIAAISAIDKNAVDPIWFDEGLTVNEYISEYAAPPVSMGCIKILPSTIVKMHPDHRIVKGGRPKKKKHFTPESKRQCVGCGGKGHFLRTCTKIEVGRLCDNLKKKVENVAEAMFAQWNGEMNPTQVAMNASADINVTFA